MGFGGLLYGFQLQENLILDDCVGAEPFFKCDATIDDRDRHLSRHLQPPFAEHLRKDYLIDGFKQPRPQIPVQLNCTVDYQAPDFVLIHH